MKPRLNGKYFIGDEPISERQAASRWFSYAQEHDIDVSRAISLWEDAVTPEGEQSRIQISSAGIRVVPAEV